MTTFGRRALYVLAGIAGVGYSITFTTLVPRAFGNELEEDTGVICDTQSQIERYVRLGQSPQAIKIINEATNACAFVNVRFIRGSEVNRVFAGDKVFQVVEILIVEANMHDSWTAIKPQIQYTLFPIEERKA